MFLSTSMSGESNRKEEDESTWQDLNPRPFCDWSVVAVLMLLATEKC